MDEIYNDYAAKKMGIDHRGQVCVMIHSGSRGLGHQVATGERQPTRSLQTVEERLKLPVRRCAGCHGEGHEERPDLGERPSAGVRSYQLPGGAGLPEGDGGGRKLRLGQPLVHDLPHQTGEQGGGGAGGGGAWFHTSSSFQAFSKVFATTPDDLDMHVIYDVSHNIAKVEEHVVDGRQRTLLVHRKGSTRAFPPHHPLIPVDYQVCVSTHAHTHTRRP